MTEPPRDAGASRRGSVEPELEERVEEVLRLARQIAGLPVIRSGSPEELIGYDEFGVPGGGRNDSP